MRDRRGVTAVAFGLSATVVIGMVGLGTEGGLWYLTRRNAQDAADPAAYAGAVRLSYAQAALAQSYADAKTQAINTATDTAARNSFPANQAWTNVAVNIPPLSGPNAGNTTAVEVIVQRTPPRLISALFLSADPVIQARGVAALTNHRPACLLGNPPSGGNVNGQLLFSGSTNVQAPNCVMASNSTRSDAISFNGNAATVTAEGFVSAGGCSNCDGSRVTTELGVVSGMVTDNPFASRDASLQSLVSAVGPYNNGSCYTPPGVDKNGKINTNPLYIYADSIPAGQAICALSVTNGNTVTFQKNATAPLTQPANFYFYSKNGPGSSQSALSITGGTVTFGAGTYYFSDSSLDINGGTVNGTGVSFLFAAALQGGSYEAGGPNIGANATVQLSPPLDGQGYPSPTLDGILFYRDARAANGNSQGNPIVNINGGPSVTLSGAMYFPNSYVKYSGSLDASICSILVGGTIEMTGNSGLNTANCADFGNITPMTKIVRLVE